MVAAITDGLLAEIDDAIEHLDGARAALRDVRTALAADVPDDEDLLRPADPDGDD